MSEVGDRHPNFVAVKGVKQGMLCMAHEVHGTDCGCQESQSFTRPVSL